MNPPRKLAAIVVAALAVLGVVSCSNSGSKDTAADSLTLAWVVDPSWAQVPVANDLGYFKQHGVNVKIVPFPTGAAALEALAGGAVDVANGGLIAASAVSSAARIALLDIVCSLSHDLLKLQHGHMNHPVRCLVFTPSLFKWLNVVDIVCYPMYSCCGRTQHTRG